MRGSGSDMDTLNEGTAGLNFLPAAALPHHKLAVRSTIQGPMPL